MGAQYYKGRSLFSLFNEQGIKEIILTHVALFRGARSLTYQKSLPCDRVPLIKHIIQNADVVKNILDMKQT